jgi:RTX calcium-binding nonapeptide repeat (4 copies)
MANPTLEPMAGFPDGKFSFESLLSPEPPTNAISTLGDVYSRYESDFIIYADKHWATEGTSWESDYYDRAEIFYNWYNRTGDVSYLERANALAHDYRTDYLEANNYGTSAHWSQIAGVALHYLATGDEASRTAVGKVADSFAAPYYLDNLGDVSAEMDCRMQARTLEAFLYAHLIDAPSTGVPNIQPDGEDWGLPGGNDWGVLLHSSLDKILSSQRADGAYPFYAAGDGQQPFMVGLLNDALIEYYTKFEADPRILGAVKKSLDYVWAHQWDATAQAFVYSEADPTPAPDLNNLVSSGFGWVYAMTGDATYKEHGNQVFAGGVNGAWLDGSKQFNQQYTSSLKYLAYTLGETPAAGEPIGSNLGNTGTEKVQSPDSDRADSGDAATGTVQTPDRATDLPPSDSHSEGLPASQPETPGTGDVDTSQDPGTTLTVSLARYKAKGTAAFAEIGELTINGTSAADKIVGRPGDDVLRGSAGNDRLQGGGGNDVLWGGAGKDWLTGGDGSDVFVFKSVADSRPGARDVITDFEIDDKLDFSAIDANAKLAGDQAFALVDQFTGKAGELQWHAITKGFVLEGDRNGDKIVDFAVELQKMGVWTNFTPDNFIL